MDIVRFSSEKSKKAIGVLLTKLLKKNGFGTDVTIQSLEFTQQADGTYKGHLSVDLDCDDNIISQILEKM
jgi:hypothetical protein